MSVNDAHADIHVGIVVTSGISGGGERYLVDLYRSLRNERIDPELIGSVPGWTEAGLRSLKVSIGPKWSRTSMMVSAGRLARDRRRYLQGIKKLHESQPFDLFHLQ